ncbi:MAG: T9SS type A sorting domain-containing protein [FCB group bacterium]|nr:T9SS type A sorting domain-containing protein [FCB group bacterium]
MKIQIALTAAALVLLSIGSVTAAVKSPMAPIPSVRDQITHDRGNISTTVDNFGYIGGYSYAGRPSGRWPSNSGHDYLAEMRFWIGGINDAGDTIVANTMDDFNPILSQISGEESYDIRLSTDTTRYEFDQFDTIGAGIGFPAEGWRVWDVEAAEWDYNDVYYLLDSTFYPGGPVSVQESICRFADDATGTAVMGIEVTQTIRQWSFEYNKDMIFFTFQITNSSTENYHDLAVGLYCDFDIGGDDPATGENGRLGDLVAFDSALDLAWIYDEDGYDPGWGPSVVAGVMGTVILSTPNDIPMTSFNTDQWEYLPTTDAGRYQLIDNTEWDESLPPTDQFYLQSIRGIDLPAGETIQLDFAMVAAPNQDYLKETAARAKALFEKNYIGPKPPSEPDVKVAAGDRAVKISWDNAAELSVEPTTGEMDFKGYKIFRSDDRGATWGTMVTNPDYSVGPDFYPIARYTEDSFGRLVHAFIDSNLVNGMEYWYSVVAYDTGTPDLSIDTLENNRLTPETAINTIRVIPRDDPLGYYTPQASIEHSYTGDFEASGDGINVYIVDDLSATGDEYRVGFTEDCFQCYWHLINTTTGDTLLADQDQFGGDYGAFPIVEGLQVVAEYHREPADIYQSEFAIEGDSAATPLFVQQFSSAAGCSEHFRNDIEIRFTGAGSVAYDYFYFYYDDLDVTIDVPFEVWNTSTNTQVGCWIVDWYGDGEWTQTDEDYIILTNFDYDDGDLIRDSFRDYLTWLMAFESTLSPIAGDVLTVEAAGIYSPEDQFDFSSNKVVASTAGANLDQIRVVPNPYMGNASWEYSEGERQIQFVNLPDNCTIRIFTLAGELLRTIDHNNGTGAENWNMLSESGRGIAAGVYLYHIESPYGEHTDKFAVIK